MLATKQETSIASGDLIPLSLYVLDMVYGDEQVIKSVFGRTDISRYDLECYYQSAKHNWTEISNVSEILRRDIGIWARSIQLKALDFYFPIGQKTIWFKNPEDAFAFKLRFGEG